MPDFSVNSFQSLIQTITSKIAGRALDSDLESELSSAYPPGSELFSAIVRSCHAGIQAGEICQHEAGGIRYGRVLKPSADLNGFSVDVVHMNEIAGPHHEHPQGEIDMIMPITGGAKFDGRAEGWLVYEPGTAHKPTVTEGEALVLYLLPGGEIKFTR